MRRRTNSFYFACVLLVLVMPCVLRAQGNPAVTAPADQAEHEALRALVPIYEQAANQGKLENLKPFLDPAFSGVMVTGEEVTDFASLERYWANIKSLLGENGSYQVKVLVGGPAEISGDMAIARGSTQDAILAKGKEYRIESRWTAVCRKRDGQWKLLRIQASMDPVTNPFVVAAVRGASITMGTLAGLTGLIAGWILHVLVFGRRKATSKAV